MCKILRLNITFLDKQYILMFENHVLKMFLSYFSKDATSLQAQKLVEILRKIVKNYKKKIHFKIES